MLRYFKAGFLGGFNFAVPLFLFRAVLGFNLITLGFLGSFILFISMSYKKKLTVKFISYCLQPNDFDLDL